MLNMFIVKKYTFWEILTNFWISEFFENLRNFQIKNNCAQHYMYMIYIMGNLLFYKRLHFLILKMFDLLNFQKFGNLDATSRCLC